MIINLFEYYSHLQIDLFKSHPSVAADFHSNRAFTLAGLSYFQTKYRTRLIPCDFEFQRKFFPGEQLAGNFSVYLTLAPSNIPGISWELDRVEIRREIATNLQATTNDAQRRVDKMAARE